MVGIGVYWVAPGANLPLATREKSWQNKRSDVMIRTAIISMIASFVLVGVWTVNLVSYHPTTDLNPLAPLSVDWN
jgi:hypothetical protein